mmetsp:Transcript_13546/g.40966  ORF Transcript_13546/g.40966 Transcript_13546/m.40966 type:complete len:408 (-) Transcript_13546:632-1855(-)
MATHPPDEVRPGLYLGGYFALSHAEELGITAVLSVVNGEMSRNMCQDLLGRAPIHARHHVDLSDEPTSNLLQHLPGCVDFIRKNLDDGHKVLVHCAAGVSRSTTVVTAFVMVSQQMDAELALKYVQMKHPPAWPNQGFRYQLKLFEDMGCKLDPDYEPFRRFLLGTLTQQGVHGQDSLPAPVEPSPTDKPQSTVRCRKCRTLLATSANVVDVEGGPPDKSVDWRKRYSGGSSANLAAEAEASTSGSGRETPPTESSIWVVPLRWMDGILGESVQGKLSCPKCSCRLGSFNWAGMRSAGGRWVTPAFQLHGNNVDTEAAGGLGALAGLKVSQPRTVRASTPAGKASDALPTASQVQPNAGSLPENTPEQLAFVAGACGWKAGRGSKQLWVACGSARKCPGSHSSAGWR